MRHSSCVRHACRRHIFSVRWSGQQALQHLSLFYPALHSLHRALCPNYPWPNMLAKRPSTVMMQRKAGTPWLPGSEIGWNLTFRPSRSAAAMKAC